MFLISNKKIDEPIKGESIRLNSLHTKTGKERMRNTRWMQIKLWPSFKYTDQENRMEEGISLEILSKLIFFNLL